jgi:hypothetical protein
MKIFNTEIPRSELLRRVGNLAQVGSVQLLSHEEGYARGSRFLDLRTGSGFRFTIQVDRGMDPGYAEFNGASLAWLAPKLFPAPAYWENDDHAWVRYIHGGLCNTAGLVTIGDPQTVDVSHFKFHSRAKDRYGTHDRIGIVPASHFTFGERWEGERCFLWAEGTVRQEIVYGENLLLTRRYETEVGTSSSTTSTSATRSSTTAPSSWPPSLGSSPAQCSNRARSVRARERPSVTGASRHRRRSSWPRVTRSR